VAASPQDTRTSHTKGWLAERVANIDGWTGLDELLALYEAVRDFPLPRALTVVEIGSWKGRSTLALALGLRARGSGRVYAIDPHTGNTESIAIHGNIDTFDEFIRNIQLAGVADVVESIRSSSHDARARFTDGSVDVLFIDGSHEYSDVVMDINDWATTLADGSIVAFNDPLFPGVHRAIRELVLVKGAPYRLHRYVENTLFFTFGKEAQWRLQDSIVLVWHRCMLSVRDRAQRPAAQMPRWAIRWARSVYHRLLP
jgi:predicted O-methyltransferase YrrM